MKIESVINGGVYILLSPENSMEEELIKTLCKQENDIVQIRSNLIVLNQSFTNGVLIGKKVVGSLKSRNDIEDKKEEV